jgi:uncharacterized repeat protein (TIGR01451 family)
MRPSLKLMSTLLLSAVAVPAFAQNADLALKVTSGTTSATMAATKSLVFQAVIANNGPSNAAGVTLGATLPATMKVTKVTGCTPLDTAAGAPLLPCKVSDQGLGEGILDETTKATVTFTVALTAAASKEALTATSCPAGASLGDIAVTTIATTTDANLADNSVTVALPGIGTMADLKIDFAGQTKSSEGATVSFDYTVTNAGPCLATNVVVTSSPENLVYVDGTGACPDQKKCLLHDLAVGATVTFSRRYKIEPPPGQDAAEGVYGSATGLDVASEDLTNDAGDVVLTPATFDPDTDTNSVRPVVSSNHAASGCASAGGAGLAAAFGLPALLLLARHRRTGAKA